MQSSNGDRDIENRFMDMGEGGRKRGWKKWREEHGGIYTTIYKIDSQWGFAVDSGNSNWGSVIIYRSEMVWEGG